MSITKNKSLPPISFHAQEYYQMMMLDHDPETQRDTTIWIREMVYTEVCEAKRELFEILRLKKILDINDDIKLNGLELNDDNRVSAITFEFVTDIELTATQYNEMINYYLEQTANEYGNYSGLMFPAFYYHTIVVSDKHYVNGKTILTLEFADDEYN